jgi:hypothetical protein
LSQHDAVKQSSLSNSIERKLFSRFYLVTIWIFLLTGFLPDYSAESPAVQTLIRWFFLILLVIPTAYSIKGLGFSYSDLGITTTNFKNSLLESTYFFLLILPFLICAKMYFYSPMSPLIDWAKMTQYSSAQLWVYCISYLPHTIGQEYVARGVGIAIVSRFLGDHTSYKPVFFVSILFSIFHLHLSLSTALMILLMSLFFGFIYRRHKTLIGVCYLHFLLGITATALGLI